jgi:hypothetical protein
MLHTESDYRRRMEATDLPRLAAWRHSDVRAGYEVLFTDAGPGGYRLRGATTAVESGAGWSVTYRIELDRQWRTRRVDAVATTSTGERHLSLRAVPGRWMVDGRRRPDLDGCVDVDFESSSVTNTVPLHRLQFRIGEPVAAPAAFVRATDLRVHRVEQRYTLRTRTPEGFTFDYESATFDFACRLTFDAAGLILDYPGIAVRDF